MCGIYKITNTINSKMYIGKTRTTFKKRWYHHKWSLRRGNSGCKYLQNAWNKYGEQNFSFDVIAEGDFSNKELSDLETIFIALYGSYNIDKVSKPNLFSKKANKSRSEGMKQTWANNYEELKASRWTHPAWDLYPQIKDYWADKSNGRGGNAHPGRTKIMKEFNIPRGITQIIINKLKSDQDTQISEGYNKQEIFNFWNNPANAQQAKYKHSGRRVIAKEFGISEKTAKQLIQEFKTLNG